MTFNQIPGQAHTGIAAIQVVAFPVPEPSTFVLATLGLLSLGLVTRRRRKR